ncbi:MAG: AAA family ATPase [Ignavibacteria bacterium]|nr:AAA family ATPase [Ignavibacteria bacterium]
MESIITPLSNPLDTIDLRNREHQERLKILGKLPQVRIIVIDSLSGAHSGKENDTGEMKNVCQWLADFAQEINKPVLCLHHFNKLNFGNELPSISKIRGSSAIIQYFRSIIGMDCPDPMQSNRKRLSVIKSNLAAFPNLLGFEIADSGHEIIFMSAPDAPRKTSEFDRAVTWLANYLKTEMEQVKIIADAKDAGFKQRTIERAKKALCIESRKGYNYDTRESIWYWSPKNQNRQEEILRSNVGGLGGLDGDNSENLPC